MHKPDYNLLQYSNSSCHLLSPTKMINDSFNSCSSLIDDFRNQVYSTIYSLISVFGLVGNGFALYVLIRTYHQRTTFHIYMLNLAIADLLCVSTLPLRVVYYVSKGQWYFGDFLCRVSSYAFYVNLYCSIFFMTAMSCTRFIAIVFPVRNLQLVTEKKAKIVCVIIWVFICLISTPFLMGGQYTEGNKTKCFEPPPRNNVIKLQILNYISLAVGFTIPFLIIIICYTGIIWTLNTTSKSMKQNKNTKTKAIRMIIIVMAAFLISFMPYHIQRTVHLAFLREQNTSCTDIIYMQKSVVVTLCLAASNCCFDPLLYFFSGENFRKRLHTFHRKSASHVFQNMRKSNHSAQDIPVHDEAHAAMDGNMLVSNGAEH
ncbi:cysteinyl leukotriene receptor 1 isoform X1 [Polypterus senegalus]|uniref:cysteinyl leukotriene receptor 1 isoform X1 n=2 Tax=Polypterus senegalus TaxID=55291 RepID=UPI00196454D1|nr:cysteinyl leukotriene receptor 1 isoform X1 [Polypterus senegalus]